VTTPSGPHLQQAQANFDFAYTLDHAVPVQRQWACTLYFYAAIHCVEAMASTDRPQEVPQVRRQSHDWNDLWVRLNVEELHRRYRRLRTTSQRARYQLYYPDEADVARCRDAATAIVRFTARWLAS
jgi:hypothetical protein